MSQSFAINGLTPSDVLRLVSNLQMKAEFHEWERPCPRLEALLGEIENEAPALVNKIEEALKLLFIHRVGGITPADHYSDWTDEDEPIQEDDGDGWKR